MVSAIVNAIEREEQEEAHSLMLKREHTRAMVRDAELQRVKQLELKKIRQVNIILHKVYIDIYIYIYIYIDYLC
jgi:Na+/phosphate symporter